MLQSGIWSKKRFFLNYSKCSQILNTFLFLFSERMFVMGAVTHKMLVRKANREDPDQTASSDSDQGLPCLLF